LNISRETPSKEFTERHPIGYDLHITRKKYHDPPIIGKMLRMAETLKASAQGTMGKLAVARPIIIMKIPRQPPKTEIPNPPKLTSGTGFSGNKAITRDRNFAEQDI